MSSESTPCIFGCGRMVHAMNPVCSVCQSLPRAERRRIEKQLMKTMKKLVKR